MPDVCGWLLMGGTLITASLLFCWPVWLVGGGGTLLGSRATNLSWGWLFGGAARWLVPGVSWVLVVGSSVA